MNYILTSIEYALLRSGFKDVFEATCNGMEKQGVKAKLILLLGVVVLGLVIMTPSAYALSFTPTDALSNDFPNLNNVAIEYRQLNGGAESGNLAGSYTTRFFTTTSTGGAFRIRYDGAPDATISCGTCGLLVKGVNGQELVFSLKNWNGTDLIQGTGFGQSGSAIAGVGIVSRAVPEPASLLLLGAGLVGLGIWRRKSTKI